MHPSSGSIFNDEYGIAVLVKKESSHVLSQRPTIFKYSREFWHTVNTKEVVDPGVVDSRTRHFHMGYGIFHCDSMRYDLTVH